MLPIVVACESGSQPSASAKLQSPMRLKLDTNFNEVFSDKVDILIIRCIVFLIAVPTKNLFFVRSMFRSLFLVYVGHVHYNPLLSWPLLSFANRQPCNKAASQNALHVAN